MNKLHELRHTIDKIDEQIQNLLTKRANVVLEIKKQKVAASNIYYSPEREAEILHKITTRNKGPLQDTDLVKIFRKIISVNRGLQKPLRAAFLGPLATFSHEAITHILGDLIIPKPQLNINTVLKKTYEGVADYGLVPIINHAGKAIMQTLDCLVSTPLLICNEISLPVNYHLASHESSIKKINTVYSDQLAFAQCKHWLENNLPNAVIMPAVNMHQACLLAKKKENSAAIVNKISSKHHKLNIITQSINKNLNNSIRFYLMGKQFTKPTTRDKTAVLILLKKIPEPIVLLDCFVHNHTNFKLIASKTYYNKFWRHCFFVEIDGHREDIVIQNSLDQIATRNVIVKILGSFPKAI